MVSDLKRPKLIGRLPPRAPKPPRPKETIGKIGGCQPRCSPKALFRDLGKTRVEQFFFQVCWGEFGGKIWVETPRPCSFLWLGWPGSLLPMDFRNLGPFAIFALHVFTFFATFAIFTWIYIVGQVFQVVYIQKAPSPELCWMWGTFTETLVYVKTLMATIHYSPFMGEWFIDSSLITVFSGARRNVLSIHIFTWQSRANAPLIHSIHASSRH